MAWGRRPRRALASAFLILIIALFLGVTAASAVQFYDGVGDPPPAYPSPGKPVAIDASCWGAQSFQTNTSYVLTSVAVWAAYNGSASDPALLEVRSDAGGRPDMGSIALGSAVVQSTSSYRWVNATFLAPVQLSAGRTYWVVLRNATGVTSTGWTWWNTRADGYVVPGTGMVSTNSGFSWDTDNLGDFDLRTYGYQETNLQAALTANRTSASSGGTVLLTLWLNNTGTEPAQQASLAVSLPTGLSYVSDNATAIGGIKGAGAVWSFFDVPGGSRWFLATVRLNATVEAGVLLTIQLTLTYTDFQGFLRPPSAASITLTSLGGGTAAVPSGSGVWVLALAILGALALAAAAFEWRRGKGVEEVFLAHDSGVLIEHFSKTIHAEKDRDILVGMLTAVQSFIKDGFSKGLAQDMRRLDFGDREILIEKGSYSYLAVVVRGRVRLGLRRRMQAALAKVEETYRQVAAEWDGGMDAFSGADDLLMVELLGTWTTRLGRWTWSVARSALRRTGRRDARGREGRDSGFIETTMDVRESASILLQLPELRRFRPRYRGILSTALVEVKEGRLSLADLGDIYTITAKMKGSVPTSIASWWDLFLRTIHAVMSRWSWDEASQAWIEGGEDGRGGLPPDTGFREARVLVNRRL